MKRRNSVHIPWVRLLGLIFFFLFAPVLIIRFLAAFFLLLLSFSLAYSKLMPRFLSASRSKDVFHGVKQNPFEIDFVIRNAGVLPLSQVSVTDTAEELSSDENMTTLTVGARGEVHHRFVARGRRRGAFALGPLKLSGTDPFGLVPWERTCEAPGTAIVYPSISPVELAYRRGVPLGNLSTGDIRYEDVTRFRSLREYVPGDETKRINWKASAKTGKLLTTEFEASLSVPLLVVLNFREDDYPRRHRELLVERAAELAASVPFAFARLNQALGFRSNGQVDSNAETDEPVSLPPHLGFDYAQAILDTIARLGLRQGSADFSRLLFADQVKAGTKLVLVTPCPSAEQIRVLLAARSGGMNIMLLQVDSPTERARTEARDAGLHVVSVRKLEGQSLHA